MTNRIRNTISAPLRKFRPTILATGLGIALFAGTLSGCSAPPEPPDLSIETEMTTTQVTGTQQKGGQIQAGSIASIQLTAMKFLLTDIKLESKSDGVDIKVKDRAAILSVDSSGASISSLALIPAAVYNKVKIKFHPLNDDERASLSDPNFADFVNNDRASVVIRGNVTQGGVTTPFVWFGKLDEELKFDMADVAIASFNLTTIALQVDPTIIFKNNAVILDPRDPANQSTLEKALKTAIHALKKL